MAVRKKKTARKKARARNKKPVRKKAAATRRKPARPARPKTAGRKTTTRARRFTPPDPARVTNVIDNLASRPGDSESAALERDGILGTHCGVIVIWTTRGR